MKNFLTDKMLHEIMEALAKGEQFNYSDGDTQLSISPNGLNIQYSSTPKINTKEKEVSEFLEFCDRLNDEFFVEVCDTFKDGELYNLQEDLDTDNYRNTIEIFVQRAKEVAESKLTEVCNAADAEIKRQELIIKEAEHSIELIHKELDAAQKKYTL